MFSGDILASCSGLKAHDIVFVVAFVSTVRIMVIATGVDIVEC